MDSKQMKWLNRILERFVLQLRIDYIDIAIHKLIMINQDNGEAQIHINNAKDELYCASRLLREKKMSI
jgi:hypothetical protein